MRLPAPATECPECGSSEGIVLESRPDQAGRIRRRRTCEKGHRWTTYEAVVQPGHVLVSMPMADLLDLYRRIAKIHKGVGGATSIKEKDE